MPMMPCIFHAWQYKCQSGNNLIGCVCTHVQELSEGAGIVNRWHKKIKYI